MDCSTNQCCAISKFNTRCESYVVPGSHHCNHHRPKATKLYLAYKRLSNLVDELDIDKSFDNTSDHIKYIMKCYNLLNNTFEARIRHRKYAFVPECYDAGHDYQFVRLKELMENCENILSNLYASTNSTSNPEPLSEEDDEEVFSDDDEDDELTLIKQKVNNHIKHRREMEADVDNWINKYIEENEEILKERKYLIYNIVKFILELFNPNCLDENDMDDAFPKSVIIYTLVHKLHSMGYLTKDHKGQFIREYVPRKCRCKECTHYGATDLVLSCKCIIENNTIMKYFSLPTVETLKIFFSILLYNKETIKGVVEDVKFLYNIYQDQLMFKKLYLIWNPLKSRLTIEENSNPHQMKASRMLAITRLKKKAYNERVAMIEN